MLLRVVAVIALTWAAGFTASPAGAVAPPVVDDALLPAPQSPAPREATEQSARCRSAARPADAGARSQLSGFDLQSIWRLSRGQGQTVAVIDTGVARHRLLPHLVPGGDYVSAGDGTQDCDGHGTVVAGIIGAAEVDVPGKPFGGLAPDATIMGIRQSSNAFRRTSDRASSGVGDVETLAMAVRTAADAGATVINISSVACLPAADEIGDGALGAALAYAVDVRNVVVVAAAGNVGGPGLCHDQNPPSDPARPGVPDWDAVKVVASPSWYDDYVLTVASVDLDGRPSTFSLAGPWVDVAAPGEAVVSLDPDGEGLVDTATGSDEPLSISGTSYAAPVVTGIAALVRSREPQLTARQVMQRIEDTARHPAAGWDPYVGHGVVDALAAISADGPGTSQSATEPPRSMPLPSNAARPDPLSRQVAFGGAAICVAAVAVASVSAGRLRRRHPPVPRD
ncbi:type VII secretion-associated serine protease mycosin [Mycolicibacterium sp. P9-64]|uniref:type VII secretion-associated serine protease mycosin n=1 Tax=Mycolicibacterium sp. P9-64 TaxID=2024612 RepID=UPI0011EEFCB4|nr:type VII secretion-associated serine protease mycosin [Mycolicibacterium sp. P9-64]KAA0075637.1 type VII secretion-associated serine protease mycosin [Mycolicibacterium sp. P9-64]